MPLINIKTNIVGLIGIFPRIIYINTDDTFTQVIQPGYLNEIVQEGVVLYQGDIAVVALKSSPTSPTNSVFLQVNFNAGDWSLVELQTTGGVNFGQQNDLAYYETTGEYVSPLPTSNSAILATNGSGVPRWSSAMTNGEVMIGYTGGAPLPSTLTAGTGIQISNTPGHITIATTGIGGVWVNQTSSTVTMNVDTGYTINNGGSLVTLTLPSTSTYGDFVEINGLSSGGWSIAQQGGQNIQVDGLSSTVGVGGSVSSTGQYDCARLRCIVPNTTWTVVSQQSAGLTVV